LKAALKVSLAWHAAEAITSPDGHHGRWKVNCIAKVLRVRPRRFNFANTIVALGLLSFASHASAQPVQDAFEGQNLTMIISFAAGGPVDGVARIVGHAMAEHLPGQPKIIYTNLPGADGVAALNRLYLATKPDGLTFLIGAGNQLSPVNLKREQVKYDPTKLTLIGGLANSSSFLLIRKDALHRIKDKSAEPLRMGAIDGTRSSNQMAIWGAEALGWNLKMIFGYAGNAAIVLALQQGEIDMLATNDVDVIQRSVNAGQGVAVAQTGMLSRGKIIAGPAVKPSPTLFGELVEGKLEGRARDAFTFWSRFRQIGIWLTLPPNTPENHAAIYRAAFQKAVADPKFVKLIARFNPDPIEMSVEDLMTLIKEMANTPDDLVEYIDQMTQKYR
jgi:tripartite-type tricarboxylate transporter receptor subunit TctC